MLNKLIRQFIYRFFGIEFYLKFVSRVYLCLISNGFLKKKYPELFFLNKIVKPGFVCIDIGANLGYYSIPMGKLTGNSGKIFSVEPVPIFQKVLNSNLNRYDLQKNVEIIPYALGDSDDLEITMGTPVVEGLLHHGYTKIIEKKEDDFAEVYNVKMFTPAKIFNNLKRLDFIKCDVEGYETHIIPYFKDLILKFKPVCQIEIVPKENKIAIIEFFDSLGYDTKHLNGTELHLYGLDSIECLDTNDLYFIPIGKQA